MPILNTLAETQSAVITDDTFGERVLLQPMAKGRVDPDRPVREIIAAVRTGGGGEGNMAGGWGTTWRAQISAGKAEAYVDLGRYPDLVLKQGDSLRALERVGKPWFEVGPVDDRNAPRLIIDLKEK